MKVVKVCNNKARKAETGAKTRKRNAIADSQGCTRVKNNDNDGRDDWFVAAKTNTDIG